MLSLLYIILRLLIEAVIISIVEWWRGGAVDGNGLQRPSKRKRGARRSKKRGHRKQQRTITVGQHKALLRLGRKILKSMRSNQTADERPETNPKCAGDITVTRRRLPDNSHERTTEYKRDYKTVIRAFARSTIINDTGFINYVKRHREGRPAIGPPVTRGNDEQVVADETVVDGDKQPGHVTTSDRDAIIKYVCLHQTVAPMWVMDISVMGMIYSMPRSIAINVLNGAAILENIQRPEQTGQEILAIEPPDEYMERIQVVADETIFVDGGKQPADETIIDSERCMVNHTADEPSKGDIDYTEEPRKIKNFLTDSEIADTNHCQPIEPRELIKWEEPDDVNNEGVQMVKGNGWYIGDMFHFHEANFGYKSTYDESEYTTVIDRKSPDYRQRLERANRLAAEMDRRPENKKKKEKKHKPRKWRRY